MASNNVLVANELRAAAAREAYAVLISDFAENNNVTVLSFNAAGLVAELSSPLVSMRSGAEANTFWYSYGQTPGLAIEETPLMVTIAIRENQAILPGQTAGPEFAQRAFIRQRADGDLITLYGTVGTELLEYIAVIGTLQPIGEAKGVILSLIPYTLLMGIALGLFLSWIHARQIARPILQISAAAERMQYLEPEAVSGIRSKDELGQLSSNLDALYASLRDNISQLQQEMEKVNRLERTKTELMQSAGHELKTPIAALSGMLEGMLDNIGVYRDKEKYLLECKGQVEKLSLLVGEILQASQAEGAEVAEYVETSVEDLLRQALADFAIPMEDKGLRLITELSPVNITTDPSALYRVFTNLISNAARHTPSGGEVHITLRPGEFTIENSCAPITPEELSRLFEPFYTGSYSRDKLESGTGLGLYIVKRNLEMLQIPRKAEGTEIGLKITLILLHS
jgi:two-component system sensor kinase Ihk